MIILVKLLCYLLDAFYCTFPVAAENIVFLASSPTCKKKVFWHIIISIYSLLNTNGNSSNFFENGQFDSLLWGGGAGKIASGGMKEGAPNISKSKALLILLYDSL